jgi:uncharacterized protein (DUF2147 family)
MRRSWILAFFLAASAMGQRQNDGVLGNWRTPKGSVVQIYHCGADACLRVLVVRRDAPSRVDGKNPDPALRSRALCGLQIGTKFRLTTPRHAEGGQLYDPESGHTYSGMITRDGDLLKLRGYIVFSLFGRTETWTRAPDNVPSCHA